jgi:hypothetical protein
MMIVVSTIFCLMCCNPYAVDPPKATQFPDNGREHLGVFFVLLHHRKQVLAGILGSQCPQSFVYVLAVTGSYDKDHQKAVLYGVNDPVVAYANA